MTRWARCVAAVGLALGAVACGADEIAFAEGGGSLTSTSTSGEAGETGDQEEGFVLPDLPPVPVCEAPATVESGVTYGVLEPPMRPLPPHIFPGEGPVAYSDRAEEGAITFEVYLPCAGVWSAWARVRDAVPGPDSPDAFAVAIDGGAEREWWYGCQTAPPGPEGRFWWLSVQTFVDELDCEGGTPLELELEGGLHRFRFRNLQGTEGVDMAMIGRVVFSTDDEPYLPDAMVDP